MVALRLPGIPRLWGRFSLRGGLLARFEAAKFARLQSRPWCKLAKGTPANATSTASSIPVILRLGLPMFTTVV